MINAFSNYFMNKCFSLLISCRLEPNLDLFMLSLITSTNTFMYECKYTNAHIYTNMHTYICHYNIHIHISIKAKLLKQLNWINWVEI